MQKIKIYFKTCAFKCHLASTVLVITSILLKLEPKHLQEIQNFLMSKSSNEKSGSIFNESVTTYVQDRIIIFFMIEFYPLKLFCAGFSKSVVFQFRSSIDSPPGGILS